MPKKIQEKHTIFVKGVLEVDGDKILLEVEDVGTKNLAEIVEKFNGQTVTVNLSYDNVIE
jgi:hypothetical protein